MLPSPFVSRRRRSGVRLNSEIRYRRRQLCPSNSAHLARSSGPLLTTLASRKSTIKLTWFGCSVAGGSGIVSCRDRKSAVFSPKQRPSRVGEPIEGGHLGARPAAFDGQHQDPRGRGHGCAGWRRPASGYPSCGRRRPSRGRPEQFALSMNNSIPSRISAEPARAPPAQR